MNTVKLCGVYLRLIIIIVIMKTYDVACVLKL